MSTKGKREKPAPGRTKAIEFSFGKTHPPQADKWLNICLTKNATQFWV
jgi:hypothetical protein